MLPNCTYSGYFALRIAEKFINKNRHLAESFGSTKESRDEPGRPGPGLADTLTTLTTIGSSQKYQFLKTIFGKIVTLKWGYVRMWKNSDTHAKWRIIRELDPRSRKINRATTPNIYHCHCSCMDCLFIPYHKKSPS